MNYVTLVTAIVTTLWTQAAAPAKQAAAQPPKQYTIEQFLNTTSINGSSFSFDESRILF